VSRTGAEVSRTGAEVSRTGAEVSRTGGAVRHVDAGRPRPVPPRGRTVRWGRLLAVWPLAFVLSTTGTVLALVLASAAGTGEPGTPGDARYVALWVPLLALAPAVVVGGPVLALVAVVLRTASLGWQVATVAWVAAWVAAGAAVLLWGPWGPFGFRVVDPATPYPWADVALYAGIAAPPWAAGSGAAWAVVRPVRPVTVVPAGR
jgi:hypothetical protein